MALPVLLRSCWLPRFPGNDQIIVEASKRFWIGRRRNAIWMERAWCFRRSFPMNLGCAAFSMSAALDDVLKLHPFRRKLGFRCRRHMD